MSKGSQQRRKEDHELASKAIYDQVRPKHYEDSLNPYNALNEATRHDRFKRYYKSIRLSWNRCEDLLDVLGGRPPTPVLKIDKIEKLSKMERENPLL